MPSAIIIHETGVELAASGYEIAAFIARKAFSQLKNGALSISPS
jgi:hypothetical protein